MTDEIVRELRTTGKRRKRNEERRSEISTELAGYVRAASKAGMTPTNIAKEAGVSRQTVHEMLRGAA